ncbi:MAG: bifunctional precorrin-2 dehydrogenase/sirohydrochlorin ferrochelatase [Bacteroidota bacterium]
MLNQLYPAFFRLDRLQMLVVGAGAVGEEKLRFILKSSPNASVTVVAPWMGEALTSLLNGYDNLARPQVQGEDYTSKLSRASLNDTAKVGHWRTSAGGEIVYLAREFREQDVDLADLVVAATDIHEVNLAVYKAAKENRRLCNIADTPDLCDFYLGSIVTRGPLKVAISTNGQSPTFAKRFRQFLEAELPELESTNLLENLKVFRDRLTGDFQAKVRQLNAVTNSLLASVNNETTACRCPDGECLVAAAAQKPAATTYSVPADAQEKKEE